MDVKWDGDAEWTGERVETRLIAAFRALPSHPVFSQKNRLLPTLGDPWDDVSVLGWTARYVPDRNDGLALLTWARCRATRESVRERYDALGWSRTSAERARQRALRRIIAGLSEG